MLELLIAGGRPGPIVPANTGPGPKELIAFGINTGFFGEVPASELISSPELSRHLTLSGTPINPNEPWLKFYHKGRILFVAKKPLQHSVSYQDLLRQGAVNGERVLTVHGYDFYCHLLTGRGDPTGPVDAGYDTETTHGSEWNDLLYYVSQDHASYPKESQEGPNWANYTPAQLGITASAENWTRDEPINDNQGITRGKVAITGIDTKPAGTVSTNVLYRPSLELTFEGHYPPFLTSVGMSFIDTIPPEDLVQAPTNLAIYGTYTPPAINLP